MVNETPPMAHQPPTLSWGSGILRSSQHWRYISISVAFILLLLVIHQSFDIRYATMAKSHRQPLSTSIYKPYSSEIFSVEQQQQYCSNYRLKPFPMAAIRKIYDLQMINTELDMLEIRLGELYPFVDYFVIVESGKTFTGKPKPLYVQENWDRFRQFHDKMIVREISLSSLSNAPTWDRETTSRNAMFSQVVPILTGDQAPLEDDVLLVSDVDEIPKPEILNALRYCDFPQRTTIMSDVYYYSFQWRCRDAWPHPQATTYKGNATILPQDLRNNANDFHFYHGGWHCSYCFGTIAELVKKITSFSHAELDQPDFKDPKKILERVRHGRDFFDRPSPVFDRIENNQDIPAFLKHHSSDYKYLLDRDSANANFNDFPAQIHS